MEKKNKIFSFIALLLFLTSVCLSSVYLNELPAQTKVIDRFEDGTNLNINEFPAPDSWILSPFTIDELGYGDYTWEQVVNEEWCYGSGTWTDPYVIENITINGQGLDNCIEIRNSDTYFIIRNCSLYNSGSNAGIFLYNVDNGRLLYNNCSNNNDKGIYLWYSNNNTLSGNIANNNYGWGLFLEQCNNNTIINNIANNNDQDGIFIYYGNDNNILNNSAMWNNDRGIYVFYNKFTLIENNTLNFNNRGLTLGQCENCFVKNNTLDSNIYFGLYCYMGTNNNISNNYINGSQEYGIYFSGDKKYIVSSNTLVGCGFYLEGALDALTSHDIKSTNTVNGKPLYYYVNSEYLNPMDFFNAGQVILINCSNSLIANQTISNVAIGISCHYCVNITISNNTLSYNNKEGIYFNECKKILVYNNSIINNYNGISIINSNYINISDNYLLLNEYNGILLSNCVKNLIINNSVKNQKNGVGIQISDSVYSTVINNIFDDNNWEAIMLSNDLNVILRNNEMNNCGLDVSGSLESLTTYDIDTSNRVNGKILYYYTNKNYLGESDFVNAGQIFLINCDNSLISNVNIKNCSIGIELFYANNNTVINTSSSYMGVGIVLLFSDNNSILRNIASNCKTSGILLLFSNNNNISENLVENSGGEGMYGGLALCYGSSNNQIMKNHINNNTIGLILYYASSNNNINGNYFFNNLEYGVSIKDIYSEHNIFYNNNFIGNSIDAEDYGTDNMWDNGIIGNYWDNYTGIDANHDGIGDTPYSISGSAGSLDNYPIWDGCIDSFPPSDYLEIIIDNLINIEVPENSQQIIDKAILSLTQAKEKFDSGMIYEAFDKVKDVVGFLMEAEELGANTQEMIDSITHLTQYIVEYAMEKTIDIVGEDNKFILRAIDDYDTALLMIELEEYDNAVMFFKNSLRNIMKARTKLIIESFVSDLYDRLYEIQELMASPIPDQALFDLGQAEQMLLLAIDQANKSLLESSFYKLIEVVLNLLDAETNGVSTSSIIESLMSNIDDVTYLKILEAESLLLGESNRHLDKALVYYDKAQELWDDGNLKSAISYYAKVIGKVRDALA